jgi:hypothetical protein
MLLYPPAGAAIRQASFRSNPLTRHHCYPHDSIGILPSVSDMQVRVRYVPALAYVGLASSISVLHLDKVDNQSFRYCSSHSPEANICNFSPDLTRGMCVFQLIIT